MAGEIYSIYADNPWGDLHMLERAPTYVPALLDQYKRRMKWNRFVGAQIRFDAMTSRQMVLTRQMHGRPDWTAKSEKTLFFPVSTFMGMERKTIEIEYHYDKVQWHEDDNLFNFTNVPLATLCRGELGWNMAQYFDYLARDAAIDSAYALYANDGSSFNDLSADTHVFELEWIIDILLGMEYENIIDSEDGMPGVACMTTPGVIRDIQVAAGGEWRTLNMFSEAGRSALLAYGISGVYMGVAFIPTLANVLWCCGPVVQTTTITAPMNTLDGVLDAADAQGWDAAQDGIANDITVASSAGFAAGDIIVIHKTLTNAYGVTNGVDPKEGTADWRVIASVPDGTHLTITEPWLKDGYLSASGGVYGYVTEAAHVHMSNFVADPGAIQMGVAQAPKINEAPPFDDMQKQHRVAWDFYGKLELINHQGLRNVFTRGAMVVPGQMLTTG